MNKIRYANIKDLYEIKKIIDDAISIDYYTEDDLKSFILSDDIFFFVYTDENDAAIACLLCEKGSLKDICEKDNIPFDDESFDKYNENTKVIIYKTAATKKSERNNGILTDFLREAGKVTTDIPHDIKLCLCLMLPNGKIPVHNHVTNDGFKQIKRFSSPWNNIKSYCSYCNSQYCKCDGMLYIKENNLGKIDA